MKSALVTGGAKRIGAGIVRALAADGWAVAVHFNGALDEAGTLTQEIVDGGGSACPLQADLTDAAATEGLIARATEQVGSLSLLVNNASLFDFDKIDQVTAESLDRHFAVNLRAPALLSRDFARQVPEGETGLIVNIQDQALRDSNGSFVSYSISKVGLEILTWKLAVNLAPAIRVNGLALGYVMRGGLQTEERFEKAWKDSPLERGGSVEEVAAAVRFLIDSPAITGQVLKIDGGLHMRQGDA